MPKTLTDHETPIPPLRPSVICIAVCGVLHKTNSLKRIRKLACLLRSLVRFPILVNKIVRAHIPRSNLPSIFVTFLFPSRGTCLGILSYFKNTSLFKWLGVLLILQFDRKLYIAETTSNTTRSHWLISVT